MVVRIHNCMASVAIVIVISINMVQISNILIKYWYNLLLIILQLCYIIWWGSNQVQCLDQENIVLSLLILYKTSI